MNKKVYIKPTVLLVPVKIETLMLDGSTGEVWARESGDLDLEEFEEEAGESSSSWDK